MSNESGTASHIISLPQGGGAAQGIGEKFSPDLHTGTGKFTVPIALPPGRNGFQPQLSLRYSTGSGNGPFGLDRDRKVENGESADVEIGSPTAGPSSGPERFLIELLRAELAEECLHRYLGVRLDAAPLRSGQWERGLAGPLHDFLSRPGKAFRARLLCLAWALSGGEGEPTPVLTSIVELFHAGSLIVDDIQDDSTHRRGRPALHRVHGLPIALNAGNWLYFWPFALLDRCEFADTIQLALHRRITRALLQCHYGQALDLSLKIQNITQGELPFVVETTTRLKTGSLTALAASLGAVAAGGADAWVDAVATFGQQVGCGLQMLDDLSDLEGRKDPLKRHEDLRLGRATWPWACLAEIADPMVVRELQREGSAVAAGKSDPEPLAATIRAILGDRLRARATALLAAAVQELGHVVGPSGHLDQLSREVQLMGSSYG